jgi:hypothetical protein
MRSVVSYIALTALAAIWPDALQAQAPGEMASVQIVNATSVPIISLRVNDTLVYDDFPQGKRSGDAPLRLLEAVYEAEEKQSGARAKSDKITYGAGTSQSLVILGDFSTVSPSGVLRQPDSAPPNSGSKYPPNVLFQVYPHTPSQAPVRLRVINGMPGKRLVFLSGSNELVVSPGDFAVLERQPAVAQYTARVDGETIPLLMRQEGLIRNAMIVFFLKDGKPSFMRAFENNTDSKALRAELEKARN